MAMDMDVTYDNITSVDTILNNAVATIVPQLTALQNQVQALLAPDGGLWLQQSSPALWSAYQQFNTSLTNGIQDINQFATQFNGIATSLQQMDTQLAQSITSSSSSS